MNKLKKPKPEEPETSDHITVEGCMDILNQAHSCADQLGEGMIGCFVLIIVLVVLVNSCS